MTLASPLKTVTQSNSIIYKGGNGRTVLVQANGSDLFLGALVTGYAETAPNVDLCGEDEPISGVIVGEYFPYKVDLDKDSDDTFDDESYLAMYVPKDKDQLYLCALTAETITIDDWVEVSAGFFKTSTKALGFGRAKQAVTGASATEAYGLVEWGTE